MESTIEKQNLSTGFVLSKEKGGRMPWVDYARGMAIILVVYRHTMVGLERSGIDVPSYLFNIQEFLVNVRMPVFFVLSGIFLGRSLLSKSPGYLVKKKVYTLLYPYLVWTIILITVQIFSSNYTNSKRTVYDYLYIIIQPRELDHMWYLLALFNTSILVILVMRHLIKKPVVHLALALGIHFVHYWVSGYSLLSDLCYFYIFLAAGVQFSQFILDQDKKPTSSLLKLTLIVTPFFITGQLFWLNHINDNYEPLKAWYLIPFLLITFVACIMFYCVCRLLYSAGVAKWLNTIGKGSLYIYILHILVISCIRIFCLKVLGVENVFVLIAVSLGFGLLIPTGIYKLSNKFSGIRYLFSLDKNKATNG